jgi:hypothetical protein
MSSRFIQSVLSPLVIRVTSSALKTAQRLRLALSVDQNPGFERETSATEETIGIYA